MASNNFVHLCGKLIRFEERVTSTGKRVCSFTLLVSNGKRKEGVQDDGHFFDIESWEVSPQLAQVLAKKVKDCRVAVTGRLKLDRWEDANGGKRSAVRVVGDVVTYVPFQDAKKPAPKPAPAPAAPSVDDEGNEIPF